MDWTTIYAETGEEELLIPLLLEEHSAAPRLSRLVSRLYHIHADADDIEEDIAEASSHRLLHLSGGAPVSSYSLQALYYLAINYILGVGCLGVPRAFAKAGFLLCTAVLLTVTLLSYMTVMWVAETGARLELYEMAKGLQPGLLRPLNDQPEKLVRAPQTFAASLLTTCLFYLLLGITSASYFGADTKSSVNLNFSDFTFGLDPSVLPMLFVICLRVAAGIVVIFPALDTISVFPLIANTLGNNLLAAAGPNFVKWIAHGFPVLWTKDESHPRGHQKFHSFPIEERKLIMTRASKVATVFWRLVAALPPLFGSLWANDLSFSLLLSGVAGIYVAFYAPSLLQLASSRRVAGRTMFGGWWSRSELAYPVLLFSTFSVGVVLIQIKDAVTTMTDS